MLRIWLPLTKDLRQQGLSNVTVTNNGATFNSAGKLGGCYSFGTGASALSLSNSFFTSFSGDFSIACWVKIITWNSSYATIWAATSTSASWPNIMAGLFRNGSSSKILFCIGNDSSSTQSSCITTEDIQLNTWYHFVCTYTSGKICLYQNGNLVSSYNTSIVPKFSATQYFNIGKMRENTYQTNSSINDFRIYDHCLSPMEVKELAKGLVLHYPLNRQGWGQENLHKNSDTITSTWSVNQGTVSNGIATITPTTSSNRRIYQMPANGGWTWQSGKTYTASIDAKSSNGATLVFYPYGAGSMSQSYTVTSEWKRYNFTFTATQSGTLSMTYHVNQTSGVSLQLKCPKLEEGSVATPWCPNSSDTLATTMGLNSTTEYDCSGFCNNLNNFANITYSSDTPKYSVSTFLSGSTYGSHNNFYSSDSYQNAMTVACWVKRTFSDATERCIANSWVKLYTYTDFKLRLAWTMSTGSADTANTWASGQILSLNEWTHVCFTMQDGIVKCYINGILKNTSDRTQYGTYIHGVRGNGFGGTSASAAQWIGGLSDFRFYATALSADDVKSLYQNSAYIDSSGNVYGTIHES